MMTHPAGMAASGKVRTSDIHLAACLLFAGVPLDNVCPLTKMKTDRGDSVTFHFMPTTIDGKTSTLDLCNAWRANDDRLNRQLAGADLTTVPTTGVFETDAVIMGGGILRNLTALRKLIIDHCETIAVRRGKAIGLFDAHAPGHIQGEILSKLKL